MGIIAKFFLGVHLTKLADAFEELMIANGQGLALENADDLSALSSTRQAQFRFILTSRVKALSSHPRHVITRELIKNAIVAKRFGRDHRVFAYTNLYDYLLARDVALDMDKFNESYGQ